MKRAKIVFLCTLFWIFWACGTDSSEKDMLDRKAFFEIQHKLETDSLISEADMLYFGQICARFGGSNVPFDSFKHPRAWVTNIILLPAVGELRYKFKLSEFDENRFSFRDSTDNLYELDTTISTTKMFVYTPQPEQVDIQMRTLSPEKGDSLRMVLAYLDANNVLFFGQTPKGDWKRLKHFIDLRDNADFANMDWAFDEQGRFEDASDYTFPKHYGNIEAWEDYSYTEYYHFYSDTAISTTPHKFERRFGDSNRFFAPFDEYQLYETGNIISSRADTVFYLHTLQHRLYAKKLANDSLVENIAPIWSDTIRSVWVWDAKARNHTLRSAKSSQKLLTDKEVWQIASRSEELDLYLYTLPSKNPNLYARIFKSRSPKQQKILQLLQKRYREAEPK
jgi:hypothetical protein